MVDGAAAEDGDDVVRAADRLPQISGGFRMEFDAEFLCDQSADGGGVGKSPGIDVHQGELVVTQLLIEQDILHEILRENHAAGTDKNNFRHGWLSFFSYIAELHFCGPVLYYIS